MSDELDTKFSSRCPGGEPRRHLVIAVDMTTHARDLNSAIMRMNLRGGDEIIVIRVADACAPDPDEVRAAVQRLSEDAFRDGFVLVRPEPRAVDGLADALRAERVTRPVSMGYSGPRPKYPTRRCLKCSAIVTEGQRCPMCGGKRTH